MATTKSKSRILHEFHPLEKLSIVDAEIFLKEIIHDWEKLSKRYTLTDDDDRKIQQCQFYAKELIKQYPLLGKKYLYFHYDEAVANFLKIKYVIQTNKYTQEALGYKPVIFDAKPYYLFPIE